MDNHLLEKITNQIISGIMKVKIKYDGREEVFWISNPNLIQKYKACEIFEEVLEEGLSSELWSEEQCNSFLISKGLWSEDKNKTLEQCSKDIENFKIELYKNRLASNRLIKIRSLLSAARKISSNLYSEKHQLDHCCSFVHATLAKTRYIIGVCLYRKDLKTKVWDNDDFLKDTSELLDNCVHVYANNKPDEKIFRKIARSDYWRSIWACRHSENSVFGKSAIELTDEQRILSNWSRLYDNCQEDAEPPEDYVMNDDDMFDGWLLMRQKKKSVNADGIENEKIKNSGEIFHVNAQPGEVTGIIEEDLESINTLNTEEAKELKRLRMSFLNKKGTVLEAEMPDSKERIRNMLSQKGIV